MTGMVKTRGKNVFVIRTLRIGTYLGFGICDLN